MRPTPLRRALKLESHSWSKFVVKVSSEVKKLADKYCDENGGPPKPKIEPFVGVDYAGTESRIMIWLDEVGEISPIEWSWLMLYNPKSLPKRRPETKFVATLPEPKLPPQKPWLAFNPTPKNPKRGSR